MQSDLSANGITVALSAIGNRIDHLSTRMDASIAFDKDVAVALENINTRLLPKEEYYQEKEIMERRLATIETSLAEIKEQPTYRNNLARVIITATAVVAAVSLAALGLNLTTLILLLSHMGMR